jgi:hypothetical protein
MNLERRHSMVDINKLRAHMVLMQHTQKSLAAEMSKRGVKTSEKTLSYKMTGRSRFDCDDADVICDILCINNMADRAEIFLA